MPVLDLTFASREDSLSVRHFAVREAISEPFEITILARSPHEEIDLEAIVGHGAGFALTSGVAHLAVSSRAWTGLVNRMELVQVEPTGLSTYALTLVPTLWRTTQRRNSRIFQHVSTPEIVTKVLGEWQIVPELRLTTKYPLHEYRVQYGESDFAFVSRLLEEAGIAYFFAHDGERSVLVMSDAPGLGDARAALPYVDAPNESAEREFVTKVKLAQRVKPGRFTIRDFDFRKNLDHQLLAEARAKHDEEQYEQYVYDPGAFWFDEGEGGDTPVADDRGVARTHEPEADRLAQRFLDAERRGRRAITFETNVVDLAPGRLFTIDPHPRGDTAGKKLLAVESKLEGGPGEAWAIQGQAFYADAPYRPERRTPRPHVEGLQSAVVVGPPGEEIHTDELGRVRVQFHWDREGRYDDLASCWMRVSQVWAGAGHGMLSLPRVGQEVLVDFFEGNPDRPVVVGRVHSVTRSVVHQLPAGSTKSGWKTETYPGGGGFNELAIEDAAEGERIHLQAQRDFSEIVKNDLTSTIQNNRGADVAVNDGHTVGGSQRFSVGGDQRSAVGEVQAIDVGGSRISVIARADWVGAGDVIAGTVGPGVGYIYAKDQNIFITNGVASAVLTPDGLYLDSKGELNLRAGAALKLSGKQVVIDGKPNVYFNANPATKAERMARRLALIAMAREKAASMPPGPERDALLATADRLARTNAAVENARLADDVYNDSGAPEGWERIDFKCDSDSGFYAAAYRSTITGKVVVAFRGSEPKAEQVLPDWVVADGGQGVGLGAQQYQEAVDCAHAAVARFGTENLQFAGHSLGGGLASAAALATGVHADTFNAAGLHENSYGYYGLDSDNEGNVDAYSVNGEFLTSGQEGLHLPTAVGNPYRLDPPPNGATDTFSLHGEYTDALEAQKLADIQAIYDALR